MMKKIVICADGTWNRPEEDVKKDFPTNVLRLARAISPSKNQQVFYDWGVGSYGSFYTKIVGGITGLGLHKNVVDNYRYIVQNYSPGDQIFLFGFSRGSYTIRSLCGMINNCGIIKRPNANLIQKTFNHYKKKGKAYSPNGERSIEFRNTHSHESREIKFVGVWDTVGAMGIPFSFLGLFNDKDEFYDTKVGGNIRVARHALAIDEHRVDFEPTIWEPRENMNIKQVWFAGAHSDVGGSYKPDSRDGSFLSDIPMQWMIKEAKYAGLVIEEHLENQLTNNPLSKITNSVKSIYRAKKKLFRPIEHGKGDVLIHKSVKLRWEQDQTYRHKNLIEYLEKNGWPEKLEE